MPKKVYFITSAGNGEPTSLYCLMELNKKDIKSTKFIRVENYPDPVTLNIRLRCKDDRVEKQLDDSYRADNLIQRFKGKEKQSIDNDPLIEIIGYHVPALIWRPITKFSVVKQHGNDEFEEFNAARNITVDELLRSNAVEEKLLEYETDGNLTDGLNPHRGHQIVEILGNIDVEPKTWNRDSVEWAQAKKMMLTAVRDIEILVGHNTSTLTQSTQGTKLLHSLAGNILFEEVLRANDAKVIFPNQNFLPSTRGIREKEPEKHLTADIQQQVVPRKQPGFKEDDEVSEALIKTNFEVFDGARPITKTIGHKEILQQIYVTQNQANEVNPIAEQQNVVQAVNPVQRQNEVILKPAYVKFEPQQVEEKGKYKKKKCCE